MNKEAIPIINRPINRPSINLSGEEFRFVQPEYAKGATNISRILSVERQRQQLKLCSYEIDVPWQLIIDLYYCLYDRNLPPKLQYRYDGFTNRQQQVLSFAVCYKNTDVTIIDMQHLFERFITSGPYYNYIAPQGYGQAYINSINFPKPITQEEYDDKLAEVARRIQQDWTQKIERQWEEAAKQRAVEIARSTKHVVAESEELLQAKHDEYLRVTLLKSQGQIASAITKAQADYAHEAKREYYLRTRQYIFAMCYYKRLDSARICQRMSDDVKMYSTDTLGWTKYDYPISRDVKIGLYTNFGYGVSSYFRIVLSYKGIPILPYSLYVHYYYANSRDLARFTRNYKPSRENWESAFKFVIDIANLAVSDPDKFVREWVMNEVSSMIDGLRCIDQHPIPFWLDKMGDKQSNSPYLHCRTRDKEAREYYEAYPHEMDVDFRAKKISGALEFLDSLKALKSIYSQVDEAINVIKSLAKGLAPRITDAIRGIQNDIAGLEKLMATWALRKEKLSGRIVEYDKKIENNVANTIVSLNRPLHNEREKEIIRVNEREKFRRLNPTYESHLKAISWCDRKSAAITCDINARKTFQESLKVCLGKICNHPAIVQMVSNLNG